MKVYLVLAACLVLCSPSSAGDRPFVPHPFPSPRHSGEGRIAFTASNVQLLGWKTLSEFGTSRSASDCWGYTSPSGREYAVIGIEEGTGFVEVTDPGNPVIVAFKHGPISHWRGVKTYSHRAYVVSEGGGGIQVYDLTSIDSGVVTLANSVAGGTCTNATHTVAIDEVSGFLYRCGGQGSCLQGLAIYSLVGPSNPTHVGDWNNRYVHECQVVTWSLPGPYQGKQIAFCFTEQNSGGTAPRLEILDVTNKTAITQISTSAYPGGVFSHQGWISAGQQHLYLNDEKDDGGFGGSRTRIFGISDLAAPSYLGFFSSGAPSVDHNLYVRGNRIYESNYRSGLHVFDNTAPAAPVQIGFFDTYPVDDVQETDSLWSNYPYFASGTIIGGDEEKGLFVWREGAAELTFVFPTGLPEFIDPAGELLRFEVVENAPGDLQPGTVKFHSSTGGPFTSVDATFLGGRLYEVAVPAMVCGQTLDFYLSAESLSQVTWTDPPASPTQIHRAIAAYGDTAEFEDTFEADSGWSVDLPADLTPYATATGGTWTRANPIGTGAQPEDDHTPDLGTACFVTANGSVGGPLGEADVDAGATALRSPVLDASGMNDPYLSYWRWFSNAQGGSIDDILTAYISNDGGSSWVLLETVGPVGEDTGGGWIRHSVRIADYVVPTNNMCVRFRVYDFGGASIVEAAVDDLRITDVECTLPPLSIASVSPSEGSFNGGNLVTIRGTGFQAGVTGVLFGGRAAQSVAVLDSTTLEARVPRTSGPASGKTRRPALQVDVTVQNPGSDSLLAAYTYAPELR
jgi:choice-of-anchor B domain-containing protein